MGWPLNWGECAFNLTVNLGQIKTPTTLILEDIGQSQSSSNSSSNTEQQELSETAYGELFENGLNPFKPLLIASTEFIPIATGDPATDVNTISLNFGEESTLNVTNIARLADIHRQIRDYILSTSKKLLSESAGFDVSEFYKKIAYILNFQLPTIPETNNEQPTGTTEETTTEEDIVDPGQTKINFLDCIPKNNITIESTLAKVIDKLSEIPQNEYQLTSMLGTTETIDIPTLINQNKDNPFLKSFLEYMIYDQLIMSIIKYLNGFEKHKDVLKLYYSLPELYQIVSNSSAVASAPAQALGSGGAINANQLFQGGSFPGTTQGGASQGGSTAPPLQSLNSHGIAHLNSEINLPIGEDITSIFNAMKLLSSKCMLNDTIKTIIAKSDNDGSAQPTPIGSREVFHMHEGLLASAMLKLKRVHLAGCISPLERMNNIGGSQTLGKSRQKDILYEPSGHNDIDGGICELFSAMAFDSIYELTSRADLGLELPELLGKDQHLKAPSGAQNENAVTITSYFKYAMGKLYQGKWNYDADYDAPRTIKKKFFHTSPGDGGTKQKYGRLGDFLARLRVDSEVNEAYAPLESNHGVAYYKNSLEANSLKGYNAGPDHFIDRALSKGDTNFTQLTNFIDSYVQIANAFANDIIKLTASEYGITTYEEKEKSLGKLTPSNFVRGVLKDIANDMKTTWYNNTQGLLSAAMINIYSRETGDNCRWRLFRSMFNGILTQGLMKTDKSSFVRRSFGSTDALKGMNNLEACIKSSASINTNALIIDMLKGKWGWGEHLNYDKHDSVHGWYGEPAHYKSDESYSTIIGTQHYLLQWHSDGYEGLGGEIKTGEGHYHTKVISSKDMGNHEGHRSLSKTWKRFEFNSGDGAQQFADVLRGNGMVGFILNGQGWGGREKTSLYKFLDYRHFGIPYEGSISNSWNDPDAYNTTSIGREAARDLYNAMKYTGLGDMFELNSSINPSESGWGWQWSSNAQPVGPVFGLEIQHRAFLWCTLVGQILKNCTTVRAMMYQTDKNNRIEMYKEQFQGIYHAIFDVLAGKPADPKAYIPEGTGWTIHKNSYNEAYKIAKNLIDITETRQKQIIECARTLKYHAAQLKKRTTSLMRHHSGTSMVHSRKEKLAIQVLKDNQIFDKVLQVSSKESISQMYKNYLRCYRPDKHHNIFSNEDTHGLNSLKLMYKILSQDGYGLKKNEKKGNKSVLHVGITNSMIREMRRKAYLKTENKKYLNTSKICINVFKKNQLNSFELLYPKAFVFDMSAHIIDIDEKGDYLSHISDYSDDWNMNKIIENMSITRWSSHRDPGAETNSDSAFQPEIIYPSVESDLVWSGVVGKGQSGNGIFNREIMINHILDYAFKKYYNLTLGLEMNESSFILGNDIDYNYPAGTNNVGYDELLNKYRQMINQLTRIYPAANIDPVLSSEMFRAFSGIRASAPFGIMNKIKKVFYPKMFDRVFSILLNEKDFILHKDAVGKEWSDIYLSDPTFKYTSELYRPEIKPTSENNNIGPNSPDEYETHADNSTTSVLRKYKSSCSNGYPELFTYYLSISILPD